MEKRVQGLLNVIGVLFGVTIMPPLCLVLFDADWFVIMVGGASWAAALLIKAAIAVQVLRKVGRRMSKSALASIQGIFSAASELGITAAAVVVVSLIGTPVNMLGIGAGASSSEALYLIALIFYKRRTKRIGDVSEHEWKKGSGESCVIRYMFVIERFTAALVHIGTRSLVWLSIMRGVYAYAIIGLMSFVLVDGTAAYGKLLKWNWFNPMTAKRFYAFVALLGTLDIAIFLAAIGTAP